jgi:hypothetical protein
LSAARVSAAHVQLGSAVADGSHSTIFALSRCLMHVPSAPAPDIHNKFMDAAFEDDDDFDYDGDDVNDEDDDEDDGDDDEDDVDDNDDDYDDDDRDDDALFISG